MLGGSEKCKNNIVISDDLETGEANVKKNHLQLNS